MQNLQALGAPPPDPQNSPLLQISGHAPDKKVPFSNHPLTVASQMVSEGPPLHHPL